LTQVATIKFKPHLLCLDQFDPRLSTFHSAVANSSTARSYFQPASQDPITTFYCTLQRCEYHLPYVCTYVTTPSGAPPTLLPHPPLPNPNFRLYTQQNLSIQFFSSQSTYLSRAMPERDGLGNPSPPRSTGCTRRSAQMKGNEMGRM